MSAAAIPDQPSPTDADDDDIHVGQVVEDLETDRPVTRDDVRVVERVGEHQATLLAELLDSGECLADMRAVEDDLRTVAATGFDLRRDGLLRHDDNGMHPNARAGPRVGLRRVAGGQRHDPPPAILRG